LIEIAVAVSRAWAASSVDPARGQPERGPPDIDGGDDVAAGIVDGRRGGIESQFVFADGGRVAAPPRPSQFLQERFQPHDRPFR